MSPELSFAVLCESVVGGLVTLASQVNGWERMHFCNVMHRMQDWSVMQIVKVLKFPTAGSKSCVCFMHPSRLAGMDLLALCAPSSALCKCLKCQNHSMRWSFKAALCSCSTLKSINSLTYNREKGTPAIVTAPAADLVYDCMTVVACLVPSPMNTPVQFDRH